MFVLFHLHPPFCPMPGKPSIHTHHSPCAKTHGSKPGSEDVLPWVRSTYGHQSMKDPANMLKLSGPGTHGTQLPQPTCPTSTGLTSRRDPSLGSQDQGSERVDERRKGEEGG